MPQTKERKAEYQKLKRMKSLSEVPINEVPLKSPVEVPLKGLQLDGSFVLSDGQVWFPDLILKAQREQAFTDEVNRLGEQHDDLKLRWARVRRYAKWLAAGRPGDSFNISKPTEMPQSIT